jgi:hypothetical protein
MWVARAAPRVLKSVPEVALLPIRKQAMKSLRRPLRSKELRRSLPRATLSKLQSLNQASSTSAENAGSRLVVACVDLSLKNQMLVDLLGRRAFFVEASCVASTSNFQVRRRGSC